uniref:Uncharacterized protein n=1 Tax=Ciona savignyi TaxID=51511 RepID=H2ZC98_CIOSA
MLNSTSNNDEELSLTLQYLLENPELLGAPTTRDSDEKCEKKAGESSEQNDLVSAYLGPQIWNDMLLSDDLKLEPVDLDDLLKENDVENESNNFQFQLSPATPFSPASSTEDYGSQGYYQDMPDLVSEHESFSSQTKYHGQEWMQSPFRSPQSAPPHPPQHYPHIGSPKVSFSSLDTDQPMFQPSSENGVYNSTTLQEQQMAIYADIMAASNMSAKSPEKPGTSCQAPTESSYDGLHNSMYKYSTPASPAIVPLLPKIDIHIPSPAKVDFKPSTSDVLISTPKSETGTVDEFDPCTRQFTDVELKPKPMVRKSRKVQISTDCKDVKYWNRR